jgi:hypothetical protein
MFRKPVTDAIQSVRSEQQLISGGGKNTQIYREKYYKEISVKKVTDNSKLPLYHAGKKPGTHCTGG